SESEKKVFAAAELIEAGLQEPPPMMFYEPGSEELAEFLGTRPDGTPSDNIPGKRHHSNERQIITPHSAVEEIDLSSWGINQRPRALLIGEVIDEAGLDELDIRGTALTALAFDLRFAKEDLDFVDTWNATKEPPITIDELLIAFDTWEKKTLDAPPVDQTTAMQCLESR
ncbi:hypothetical protein FOZ63_010739, partial [Perkinsus olseni]